MREITDNQIIVLVIACLFVYYMADMAWASLIALFRRK